MKKFTKLYEEILSESREITGKFGEEIMDKIIRLNNLPEKYSSELIMVIPELDKLVKPYIKYVASEKAPKEHTTIRYHLKNGTMIVVHAQPNEMLRVYKDGKEERINPYQFKTKLSKYLKESVIKEAIDKKFIKLVDDCYKWISKDKRFKVHNSPRMKKEYGYSSYSFDVKSVTPIGKKGPDYHIGEIAEVGAYYEEGDEEANFFFQNNGFTNEIKNLNDFKKHINSLDIPKPIQSKTIEEFYKWVEKHKFLQIRLRIGQGNWGLSLEKYGTKFSFIARLKAGPKAPKEFIDKELVFTIGESAQGLLLTVAKYGFMPKEYFSIKTFNGLNKILKKMDIGI